MTDGSVPNAGGRRRRPRRERAAPRSTATERRLSGRVQRKPAGDEAARRRLLSMVGAGVAVLAVVALGLFLRLRPRPAGPAVLVAPGLPAEIVRNGRTLGNADAPVTVVEGEGYT